MKKLILVAVLFTAFSCNEFEATQYSVDPKLSALVDTFYSEMSERGFNLDKSNLIAKLNGSQAAASGSIIRDQRYLYVGESILNESTAKNPGYIQYQVFNALGEMFINKKVTTGYTGSYNIETFFNDLVD